MNVGDIVIVSGMKDWRANQKFSQYLPPRWERDEFLNILSEIQWKLVLIKDTRMWGIGDDGILNIGFLVPNTDDPMWTDDLSRTLHGHGIGEIIREDRYQKDCWWAPIQYLSVYRMCSDPISSKRVCENIKYRGSII